SFVITLSMLKIGGNYCRRILLYIEQLVIAKLFRLIIQRKEWISVAIGLVWGVCHSVVFLSACHLLYPLLRGMLPDFSILPTLYLIIINYTPLCASSIEEKHEM